MRIMGGLSGLIATAPLNSLCIVTSSSTRQLGANAATRTPLRCAAARMAPAFSSILSGLTLYLQPRHYYVLRRHVPTSLRLIG